MKKTKSRQPDKKSSRNQALRASLLGFFCSAALCILCLILFAVILSKNEMSLSTVWVFSTITLVLSAFAGGFVSAWIFRCKGILFGAVNGFLTFLLLLIINFSTGGGIVLSAAITKLITAVSASALGGIMGINLKFRRRS